MGRINSSRVRQPVKNKLATPKLYFALESLSEHYGGPIRSVSTLAKLLSDNGYEISFLQANSKVTFDNNFLCKYGELISSWGFFFSLLFAKDRNFVVIFNNQWTPIVQLMGLLLVFKKINYIWCVRGSLKVDNFKKHFVWIVSQRYLLRKSHSIIVSSEVGKSQVLKDSRIRAKDVHVIPNIMDTAKMPVWAQTNQNKDNHNISVNKEELSLLYIGRINKKKNIHDILLNIDPHALPHQVTLRVAGYSDDPDYAKYLVKLAKVKSIKFELLENVTEIQKVQLLKQSDAFITMSSSENFGIAIFEALQKGLPTIVNTQIDFWPNSGFASVSAISPSELNQTLTALPGKLDNELRAKNQISFCEGWAQLEEQSRAHVITVFQNVKP